MKLPGKPKLPLIAACLAFLLFGWIVFYDYLSLPVGQHGEEVVFEIKPGMNLKQISNSLAEQNIIKNSSTFQLLAFIDGKETQMQAGEYRLSPAMPAEVILNKLTSGQTVLHPITIPEGLRITEIAALLQEKGLADKNKFILETKDASLIHSLKIPINKLEGYLFPETYHFSKNTGEKKMVETMINMFKERVLKQDILDKAKTRNMSLHEVVTLASIIEKETGQESERTIISSVFHNRLKKNMLLQTDPTVIYALADFDGNIRKKDLSVDSPYNTYKYPGLPPGPIASPGLESILAALNPDKSEYLYFVSRKDGSHQFSKTYEEHDRAVKKFQLNQG